METVKLISKQFSLKFRDILNSLFIGVGAPVLFAIQGYFDSGKFKLNKESLTELAMVSISAFVINLIRKFTEKSKVVIIEPLGLRDPEPEPELGDDTKPVPPPYGDPTHPPKK